MSQKRIDMQITWLRCFDDDEKDQRMANRIADTLTKINWVNMMLQFALEYYSDWGTYNQHLLTVEIAESLRARAVQALADLKGDV